MNAASFSVHITPALPQQTPYEGDRDYNGVYRGNNGRYHCRRNDGTNGLIIGAVAGGLLENGRSSLLGTLLGAGGGAVLGRSIDRGQVSCR